MGDLSPALYLMPRPKNILKDALRGDADDEKIRINRKYAAKFEEKKKREDLDKARHQEEEEDESDSESEDSEGNLLTPQVERSFLELLPKIHARQREIYEDKEKKYFPQYEEIVEQASQQQDESKAEKPFRMNDYVRKVILQKMDNEDDDRSDDEIERDEDRERAAQPTPHEELMAIKKRLAAHADSSEDEDSDEDVFVLRSKTDTEKQEEDQDFVKWEKVKKQNDQLKSGKALKSDDILAHFWSVDQTDDPNEKFLRRYIVSEGWVDRERDRLPSYDEIIQEDEEDQADLVKQDEFEHKYNFRFEEPGGTEIASHPREIDDTVRRKSDKRKKKREARKAKKQEEQQRKQEELKRLKNLKKEEIKKKIEEIQKVTQNRKIPLHQETLEKLIEGDYDPEVYEQEMSNLFSEDYYDDDDIGPDGKPVKPTFDDEDEAMPSHEYNEDEDMDGYYEEEDPGFHPEAEKSKGFKKMRKAAAVPEDAPPELMNRFIEEYYNLDYEDMVGDQPVRFTYQKVKPDSFGLDPLEILEADERDLNAYVSLKQLAPYRNKDPKVNGKRNRKRKQPDNRYGSSPAGPPRKKSRHTHSSKQKSKSHKK